MEPMATSTMTSAVAGYLAKTLKDNKSIQDFFRDFTDAAVAWLRPVFLKDDDQPREVLANLQHNPASEARQAAVKSALEVALEDAPAAEALLREMYQTLLAKAAQGQPIHIEGSKNVVTGHIQAGGNVTIGDGHTTTHQHAKKIYNIDQIDQADFS